MRDHRISPPFWRLVFLVALALLAPPHAAPHVRAPDAAPRSAAWTVDPSGSQATIAPHWAPFAPCRRARSVQRCASSRGRTFARFPPRRAGERIPPIATYTAADLSARRAWFLAALPALQGWALRVAARRAEPGEDPRDAVQGAFAGALERWHAFTPDPALPLFRALRRWFSGVLRNVQLDAQRGRRTRYEVSIDVVIPSAIDAPGEEVEIRYLRAPTVPGHEGPTEAGSVLGALRASTTAERWEAWFAHAAEGRTVAEIAARTGLPHTTIDGRIHLAKKDFAPVLARLEEGGAS